MMKQLETPKTLEELYKVADEILKVDETKPSGEVVALKGRTVVDNTLEVLGQLGFLRNN